MTTDFLFKPVVPSDRFHPSFALLLEQSGSEPTRLMMEEVFGSMSTVDENFVEQFQTNGFDARVFELFLYAYLTSIGGEVSRVGERPDFLVTRDSVTAVVEATTANATQTPGITPNPVTGLNLQAFIDEDTAERVERSNQEIPIRFGSALFTKLRKRYWRLAHVTGRPLVVAIEGFHTHDALTFSSASLAQYLYGIRQTGQHDADGRLIITTEAVDAHQLGAKAIPSNFFAQPEAENVSAVLFTNAGTVGKFTRMGYQAGLHRGNVIVTRYGTAWDSNPTAAEPVPFMYRLDEAPGAEPWGSGVEIFHNPNALHPLSDDFFADAVQTRLRHEVPVSLSPSFVPFTSINQRLHLGFDSLRSMGETQDGFGTVLRREFEARQFAQRPDFDAIDVPINEVAWFGERSNRVAGVVLRWHGREQYDGIVLKPDENDVWRYADNFSGVGSLDAAATAMLDLMRRLAT